MAARLRRDASAEDRGAVVERDDLPRRDAGRRHIEVDARPDQPSGERLTVRPGLDRQRRPSGWFGDEAQVPNGDVVAQERRAGTDGDRGAVSVELEDVTRLRPGDAEAAPLSHGEGGDAGVLTDDVAVGVEDRSRS